MFVDETLRLHSVHATKVLYNSIALVISSDLISEESVITVITLSQLPKVELQENNTPGLNFLLMDAELNNKVTEEESTITLINSITVDYTNSNMIDQSVHNHKILVESLADSSLQQL